MIYTHYCIDKGMRISPTSNRIINNQAKDVITFIFLICLTRRTTDLICQKSILLHWHRHLQITEIYTPNQTAETKFCCPSQNAKPCSHHSSQVISIISTVSVWSNLNCQYLMSNAICQHKKRTGELESGSQVPSSQFYIPTHYTTILAGQNSVLLQFMY